MPTRRLFLQTVTRLTAAIAVAGFFASTLHAAPIHVFGSSSQYGTVDSATGAYTSIGRLTDSFTNASIALSGFTFGGDGQLYGVTGIDGSGTGGEGNYLWRFNPATGASTDRRDLSVPFVTVARRPSDNRIFGYVASNGVAELYSLDLSTFAPAFIGSTGIVTFGGLAFDAADNLYLADSLTGDVLQVNSTTAQTTLFARTGVDNVPAMAAVGDSLHLFDTDDLGRYRVSLQTGVVTFDGTYDIGGGLGANLIYGATIAPLIIPESPTGALLALVLSGGILARRYRR